MRKFLLGCMLLTLPIATFAAGISVTIHDQVVVFKDVDEKTWYAPFIKQAAELGIVNGYMTVDGKFTGKFGPNDSVTISQALKMTLESAGYFSDGIMPVECEGTCHWAVPYRMMAKGLNWEIRGLNPIIDYKVVDSPATRAEVSRMIVNAYMVSLRNDPNSAFVDVSADAEYSGEINALAQDGIVTGDTDASGEATGYFRPSAHINRAEVVKMVMEAREYYGLKAPQN